MTVFRHSVQLPNSVTVRLKVRASYQAEWISEDPAAFVFTDSIKSFRRKASVKTYRRNP